MGSEPILVFDDRVSAQALLDGGAELKRHSLRMVLDLTRPIPGVAADESVVIEPISITRLNDYAVVMCRAYGGGHPDHEPGDDDPVVATAALGGYLRGDELGPLIGEASLHAVTRDGKAIGAIIVSDFSPGVGKPSGPWITDLFVDPSWVGRGIGAALITESVARLVERGDRTVGLAVTVGNPAQQLYERIGFNTAQEVWRFAHAGGDRPATTPR